VDVDAVETVNVIARVASAKNATNNGKFMGHIGVAGRASNWTT